MKKWCIGVDEAGRGPLAGPVAVGAAIVPDDFDWGLLNGVTDSKKLTQRKREAIFELARKLQKEGKLDFAVSMSAARIIDRDGITVAINRGIGRALARIESSNSFYGGETYVTLDGGLRAPERFLNQRTINGGDASEKVIGLASILAKVTRDRYMARIAALPQFAPYGFEIHKGYGTKRHREFIEKLGLSTEHRTTFCKNIKVLYN